MNEWVVYALVAAIFVCFFGDAAIDFVEERRRRARRKILDTEL